RDLSSLRFALCGAAPMPVELIRQFEARTGLKVIEGYGLTEGTCGTSCNPRGGERRPGSIGLRLPYCQVKVAVLDGEGNYLRDAAPNEVGNLCLKGPTVFKGYLQQDRNRDIWIGDGWFNTGDLGRIDEDGYIWLTGRSKDLIIRGGHNIDPQMIEEALHRHPAVALAAAVGKPDAKAGELP
ncbi:AMP-binding protein, partial [Pseudomonas aeruginosa]